MEARACAFSFMGRAIDSPSRIASQTFWYIDSNIALPAVSLVMLRASRMGTPEETSVPRVRVVRATMFFSTSGPKMGILMRNRSNPSRPYENFRTSLTKSQMAIGIARDEIPAVLPGRFGDKDEGLGHVRQLDFEIGKDVLEGGDDLQHDEDQDADGESETTADRVGQCTLDFPFEGFGPLFELGQTLENDFEGTARLAGLDHVDVEAVEGLGAFGHCLGEGGSGFDFLADVDEAVFEGARLLLFLQDVEAPENGESGVLQRWTTAW